MSTTEPGTDPMATLDASTADAIPVDGMPAADATPPPGAAAAGLDPDAPTGDVPVDAATAEPAPPPAVALATDKPRRRFGSAALFARLLRFAFAIVLLAAGAYAGYQVYLDNRPAAAIPGDPAVVGIPTPPAVAELAAAIGSDDANAIRVALNADMFSSYAADMERFGITRVRSVETLGTFDDGDRSATALVINGQTADGSPFTINLVVIAQGGQIVRLR